MIFPFSINRLHHSETKNNVRISATFRSVVVRAVTTKVPAFVNVYQVEEKPLQTALAELGAISLEITR